MFSINPSYDYSKGEFAVGSNEERSKLYKTCEKEGILGFLEATDDQKDYSIISQFVPKDVSGKCVYCNHCKPCPQSLDIGLINKYYDLALGNIPRAFYIVNS